MAMKNTIGDYGYCLSKTCSELQKSALNIAPAWPSCSQSFLYFHETAETLNCEMIETTIRAREFFPWGLF